MSLFRRYLKEATYVACLMSSGKEFQARIVEGKKEFIEQISISMKGLNVIRASKVVCSSVLYERRHTV